MELINRYVYAVTRRLPEKQRADVARELRSDIETMVAERNKDGKLAKADVKNVLVELGDPEKFARQYQDGKRYLISPLYFDTYTTLLKSLLIIVLPIVAVFTVITDFFNTNKPGVLILDAVGAVVEVGVHIFFWLTIIIAIIDRAGIKPEDERAPWKPEDLPPVPEGARIPKSDLISGLIWSTVAVAGSLWQVPVIHDAIAPSVPLFFSADMWPWWTMGILLISIISFIVEILRLVRAVWDKVVAWAITLVNILVAAYFTAIVFISDRVVSDEFVAQFTKNAPDIDWRVVMANGVIIFAVSIVLLTIYETGATWRKYKKEMKG